MHVGDQGPKSHATTAGFYEETLRLSQAGAEKRRGPLRTLTWPSRDRTHRYTARAMLWGLPWRRLMRGQIPILESALRAGRAHEIPPLDRVDSALAATTEL